MRKWQLCSNYLALTESNLNQTPVNLQSTISPIELDKNIWHTLKCGKIFMYHPVIHLEGTDRTEHLSEMRAEVGRNRSSASSVASVRRTDAYGRSDRRGENSHPPYGRGQAPV